MGVPWIRKYLPKNASDIEGQDSGLKELREFAAKHKSQKKKAAIVYGPSGCGKTAAVYVIAKELGYEVVEVNASDFRNEEQINRIVGAASKQMSLFSKGKIILIDEIDGLSGMEDRGGVSAITRLIDTTYFPMVCTGNNPYDKKFSQLRAKCSMIEFSVLGYVHIFNVLNRICKTERVSCEEDVLKSIARMCGGDLRAAINDLESLARENPNITKEDLNKLSQRERKENIIDALVRVLKTTDPKIAIQAFDNVDEDLDKCALWLDENIPKEYTNPADLVRAYDYLSKSDVFNSRIRRWQHWRFLIYINAFLTAGVAVSKDEKYKSFVSYSPPQRILKIWQANMKYEKRKAIAQKIAAKTHTSKKRVVKDVLPYLQPIFKNNRKAGEEIAQEFGLEKEELEWLRK